MILLIFMMIVLLKNIDFHDDLVIPPWLPYSDKDDHADSNNRDYFKDLIVYDSTASLFIFHDNYADCNNRAEVSMIVCYTSQIS